MEVAIIGSGVAGALVAWKLAQAGMKVTILEAGGAVQRDRAVQRYRKSPRKTLDAPFPQAAHAPSPLLNDLESHLRQLGPELFMGVYLRQVGGTTWHWLGTATRLLPEDFQMWTLHKRAVDWPLSYADLEPWYTEAERQLGVSGESTPDITYPMPAIEQATVDRFFGSAARELGLQVHPLPQARNSRTYQGRPRCCGSASCIPICPIGAKYDAGVHLKLARKAGAELRKNHVVASLVTSRSGRIKRAEYLLPDGTGGELTADLFVLATHSVETPRILLNSHCERYPEGLANSSDQVGRNLMGGHAMLSWGLAPKPVFPYRAPQATSGIFDFRGGTQRRDRSGFLTSIATDGWPSSFQLSDLVNQLLSQGLKGSSLRETLADHVSRQVALVSTCEQLPDPRNRIAVSPDWPDPLGIPRPTVRYHRVDDYTRVGMIEAKSLHTELFARLGVTEEQHSPSTDPAYILGTTRMGAEPENSVVNSDLRCHDHGNLFVVGGSVFPTTGSGPPTLTVAALALRAANHITHLAASL